MTAKWPIPRPTEHAALRACDRSTRRLPPVPALMAALVEAVDRHDREGICLASHRVVRAAAPEVVQP
ncbi:hypothetical protein OHB41_07850 [Streptomyces sp. NBC_01571]|uniref:hypothetical protein n=1 Tax=Streptomyces sp. NBC_01571 TaxID=2975883 RepID=UPI0022532092|nr:hypothetical protein [Streptomyces sp. NBC_01571]MCX4573099.1 hypothetical protein [Streptomyces sp. NBC_01571]